MKKYTNKILDYFLKIIVYYNPNHCFKREWEEIENKNNKIKKKAEEYVKEADKKYEELRPIYDMVYTKSIYDKYCAEEALYKNIYEDILFKQVVNGEMKMSVLDVKLKGLKKAFEDALLKKEYIVRVGHHNSIKLDLSTCKKLIDDLEKINNK